MRGATFTLPLLLAALGLPGVALAQGTAVPESSPTQAISQQGEPAQAAAAGSGLSGPIRWGLSMGLSTYRESAMRLSGLALGLRAQAPLQIGAWPARLEAEVSVGMPHYSSPSSGTLEGGTRLASAWHLILGSARTGLIPQPGLSITTDWTDLRGQTSNGQGGYERLNRSLWLSANWLVARDENSQPWRLRAGLLLAGWQASYLSQVSSSYGDSFNRQHRGASLELEAPWRVAGIDSSLRLGFRAYSSSDSDQVRGLGLVYEPSNRALEMGITIWR